MSVRTEKNGAVWTVILSRAEARNAVDPDCADVVDFDGDHGAREDRRSRFLARAARARWRHP